MGICPGSRRELRTKIPTESNIHSMENNGNIIKGKFWNILMNLELISELE